MAKGKDKGGREVKKVGLSTKEKQKLKREEKAKKSK